jgi:hypothetical protein
MGLHHAIRRVSLERVVGLPLGVIAPALVVRVLCVIPVLELLLILLCALLPAPPRTLVQLSVNINLPLVFCRHVNVHIHFSQPVHVNLVMLLVMLLVLFLFLLLSASVVPIDAAFLHHCPLRRLDLSHSRIPCCC